MITSWIENNSVLSGPYNYVKSFFDDEPKAATPAPAPSASKPLVSPAAPPKDILETQHPSGKPKTLNVDFVEGLIAMKTAAKKDGLTKAQPHAKIEFDPPIRLQDGVNMYMPKNPVKADGSVDFIVQFRGVVPNRFKEGGVNAVVITTETQGLSGAMMQKFGAKSFTPQILDRALARVQAKHGQHVKQGRLALGSFSAGYAPLQVALSNPEIAAKTDAVMVIDGIHYGKAGQPNPTAHQPFVDFARQAARGDKLMVITHSAIKPTYASSTDAADYIANQVGATRVNNSTSAPDWSFNTRYGYAVSPSTLADKGHFHIEGYDGGVAKSHVEQIDNLGNLWNRYLAPRWD